MTKTGPWLRRLQSRTEKFTFKVVRNRRALKAFGHGCKIIRQCFRNISFVS